MPDRTAPRACGATDAACGGRRTSRPSWTAACGASAARAAPPRARGSDRRPPYAPPRTGPRRTSIAGPRRRSPRSGSRPPRLTLAPAPARPRRLRDRATRRRWSPRGPPDPGADRPSRPPVARATAGPARSSVLLPASSSGTSRRTRGRTRAGLPGVRSSRPARPSRARCGR
jgi:hypothetical protein